MWVEKIMRKTILLILFLGLLVGCASTEQEEIKIGVLAPLTGPIADYGQDMKESYELAITEFNENHQDKKIKLIYEDTCIDLKATTTALKKFKEVDNVMAVLGPFCGSENVIAGEFSTQNNLFIISPGDNFGKNG